MRLIFITIIPIFLTACAGMRADYSVDYARYAQAKANCAASVGQQVGLEAPLAGGGVLKLPPQMFAGYKDPCDMTSPQHAGAYAASVANKGIGVGGAVVGGIIIGNTLEAIVDSAGSTINASTGSNVTLGDENVTSSLPQTHTVTNESTVDMDGTTTNTTTETSEPFVPEPVIVDPVIIPAA